ncbi:hypothetical protein GTY75_30560 [Streptomyces sp. SID8381]|uniref:hypothetical protein n=1 Tax=unclassified Streptomyces TaxID=2593676 RepID=UPI0003A22E1A|nr:MULTISPECIES: hypothetical protein [unclassified Streptomyces]MYX30915.1 hypothetical protein [Streptomyces sp. SID8381]
MNTILSNAAGAALRQSSDTRAAGISSALVADTLTAFAVMVLFAIVAAAGAIVLTRLDGGTWPSALFRGAVAFGGTLTLELLALGTVVALLS